MGWIVATAAGLVRGTRLVYAKKWSFLGVFATIFVASVFVLAQLDLLPNALSVKSDLANSVVVTSTTTPVTTMRVEEPVRINIPSLGLTATIANPTSTDVVTLDKLLLKGAVRYPTSAKLGENGNVVLFGHSSYLPIVGNQAYKTLNQIQKLKKGDTVTVYSAGTAYTYAVRTMEKKSASDGVIPLTVTGRVLTLATCDSFGAKSDRFVVTADFVESHSVGA